MTSPGSSPSEGVDRLAAPFSGWHDASRAALLNSVALGTTVAAASAGTLMGIGWALAGRFAAPALPASPLGGGRAHWEARRAAEAGAGAGTEATRTSAPPATEPEPDPTTGADAAPAEMPAPPEPEVEPAGAIGTSAGEPRAPVQDFDAVEEAVAAMPRDLPFAQESVVPFLPEAGAPGVDALLSSAAMVPGVEREAHRPAGLDAPRGGVADDLKRIAGIGPKLERMLNDLGIHHYDQIAGWTEEELAWVNRHLRRKGRVGDENWRAQAGALASGVEV